MKIHIILSAIILLSACAVADFQTPIPTLPPPLEYEANEIQLTLEGSCEDDPRALEVWLGTAIAIQQNLPSLMDEAITVTDAVNDESLVRIIQMRITMGELPAPDCTQQAHLLLVEAIDVAINGLQSYREGALVNIQPIMDDVTELLQQSEEFQNSLFQSFTNE